MDGDTKHLYTDSAWFVDAKLQAKVAGQHLELHPMRCSSLAAERCADQGRRVAIPLRGDIDIDFADAVQPQVECGQITPRGEDVGSVRRAAILP